MTVAAWADLPIENLAEDTLDRGNYAAAAAQLIHSTFSYKTSVVFGLSGPWGSGKTSFISLIENHLLKAHPEWRITRFTPWATSDEAGLIAEFYASLARELPVKKSRELRKALATAAVLAAPTANLIPYAGASAADLVRAGGEAMKASKPWQDVFKQASDEIEKLKRPILVVVDDVDRLHSSELMTLLKVVRLLGRFPGVQYLLAYDDETLHRALAEAGAAQLEDGSAERFMEKIVQYPLLVPPLLRHQQITRLHDGLLRTTRGVDASTADIGLNSRIDGLMDCFTSLLQTPRAIDRYIAQLEHHIPLLAPGEIDDEDVILLTLIRVAFPALFNDLPKFREQLLTGHSGQLKIGTSIDRVSFDVDLLIRRIPVEHAYTGKIVLASLFPKLEWPPSDAIDVPYPSTTGRGIAMESYFDRYFAMGIPSHDISDEEVRGAVAAAAHGDPVRLTALLLQPNDDRAQLVISKAMRGENIPASKEGRLDLGLALAAVATHLTDDRFTSFGRLGQVLAWTGSLLGSVAGSIDQAQAHKVLAALDSSGYAVRAMLHVEEAVKRVQTPNANSWLYELTDWLVGRASDDFIAHLAEGDVADPDFPQGTLRQYVIKHGGQLQLRARIGELIDDNMINIDDLAARFVSAAGGSTDDSWSLYEDVDQEGFAALAPPADDPWYQLPKRNVDLKDLSWANRRAYATGRFTKPIAIPLLDDPDDTQD